MKPLESKIEKVFHQFDQLEKVLIDASSIIYIQKTGFLLELANTVSLFTLTEILKETGFKNLPIQLVKEKMSASNNDQKFVECAKKKKMAVVTEDKKIIKEIKKENLPYFNALMMLNFLIYKDQINREQHTIYFRRLKQFAWYSSEVYEYSRNVFDKIKI